MDTIGKILSTKHNRSAVWKGVSAALIVEHANLVLEDVFGEQIKNAARVVYFKSSTITIAALSSVASQEIKLQENKILDAINEKFGLNKVRKIKYLA